MTKHPQSHILKAALWMIGAIFSFSSMAVAGRQIADSHDTFEIMMYRSFIGLGILCMFLTYSQRWREITTHRFGMHIARNVVHFSGQNLWFYAITVIPLAQVFTLEFTSPIWVIVLAPFLLNEAINRSKMLSAVLGFIGVLIVARPTPETIDWGVACAAFAAFFFALTYIFTRNLTQTVSVACILFWMTAIQAILGIITVTADFEVTLPTLTTTPWLLIVAVAGLLAHFCISTALTIAPATVVVVFEFGRLPFIFVVGWLLYDEDIELWVVLGALLIFSAIYLNVWSETRAATIRSNAKQETHD